MNFLNEPIEARIKEDSKIRAKGRCILSDEQFLDGLRECAEQYGELAIGQAKPFRPVLFAVQDDDSDAGYLDLNVYPFPESWETEEKLLTIVFANHISEHCPRAYFLAIARPRRVRTKSGEIKEVLLISGQSADQRFAQIAMPTMRSDDGKISGYRSWLRQTWLRSEKLLPNKFLLALWVLTADRKRHSVDTSQFVEFSHSQSINDVRP